MVETPVRPKTAGLFRQDSQRLDACNVTNWAPLLRGAFLCWRETDDQRHRSGVDHSKRLFDKPARSTVLQQCLSIDWPRLVRGFFFVNIGRPRPPVAWGRSLPYVRFPSPA
jgi:hypothetical protein